MLSGSNVCLSCDCTSELGACHLCFRWEFTCPGTCGCCIMYRIRKENQHHPQKESKGKRQSRGIDPKLLQFLNKKRENMAEINRTALTGTDNRLPTSLAQASTKSSFSPTIIRINPKKQMNLKPAILSQCNREVPKEVTNQNLLTKENEVSSRSSSGISMTEDFLAKKQVHLKPAILSHCKREVPKEVTDENVLTEENEVSSQSSSGISITEDFLAKKQMKLKPAILSHCKREVPKEVTNQNVLTKENEISSQSSSGKSMTEDFVSKKQMKLKPAILSYCKREVPKEVTTENVLTKENEVSSQSSSGKSMTEDFVSKKQKKPKPAILSHRKREVPKEVTNENVLTKENEISSQSSSGKSMTEDFVSIKGKKPKPAILSHRKREVQKEGTNQNMLRKEDEGLPNFFFQVSSQSSSGISMAEDSLAIKWKKPKPAILSHRKREIPKEGTNEIVLTKENKVSSQSSSGKSMTEDFVSIKWKKPKPAILSHRKREVLKEGTNQNMLKKEDEGLRNFFFQVSSQSSSGISMAEDSLAIEQQEPTSLMILNGSREYLKEVTNENIGVVDNVSYPSTSALSMTENLIPVGQQEPTSLIILNDSREYLEEVTDENIFVEVDNVRIPLSSALSTTENLIPNLPSSIESGADIKTANGICTRCNCVRGSPPCNNCSLWAYRCPGDCPCCVKHRAKVIFSLPPDPSEVVESNSYYCPRCSCQRGEKTCFECQSCRFKCLGVCDCCRLHRQKKNIPNTPIETDIANIERYCPLCQHELVEGTCIECPYASNEDSNILFIGDVAKEVLTSICKERKKLYLTITTNNNETFEFEMNKFTIEGISDHTYNLECITTERNVLLLDVITGEDPLLSSTSIFVIRLGSIPRIQDYNSASSSPLFRHSNRILQSPVQHNAYGGAAFVNNSERSTQSPCAREFSQWKIVQSPVNSINTMARYYCNHCECIRGKEPCATCRRNDMECLGCCKCCEKFNRSSLNVNLRVWEDIEPISSACGFPENNLAKIKQKKPKPAILSHRKREVPKEITNENVWTNENENFLFQVSSQSSSGISTTKDFIAKLNKIYIKFSALSKKKMFNKKAQSHSSPSMKSQITKSNNSECSSVFPSHKETEPMHKTEKDSAINSTRQVKEDDLKDATEAVSTSQRTNDINEDYSHVPRCIRCQCIKNCESCEECRPLNLECRFPTNARFCTCCQSFEAVISRGCMIF